MRTRILALLLPCALSITACSSGGNTSSTGSGSCTSVTGDYPKCPYGVAEGKVIENAPFVGRRAGISSTRETIDLASYHALRSSGKKVLVLNVAALWCSPCKEEAKEFQDKIVPEYDGKGVAVLSVVLEDAARKLSTDEDVDNWIKTFGLTYPVARDPDGFVTEFFDKNQMPLNMVIDLTTMKITAKIVGADLAKVRSEIDKALAGG
jgi:peroxiredoxin